MMKLINILWQTTIFATVSLAAIAQSQEISIIGAYKSNGYTLDLNANGDYYSCDPRNRCLKIPHTQASKQGRTRIWQRVGYRYRVTPIGKTLTKGRYTKISVRVINPKSQVIFDRVFRSQ